MKRVPDKPPPPPPPPPPLGGRHNANGALSGGGQQPSNKCLIHPNAFHFTRKCKVFKSKSVEERAAIINDKKACHLCLGIDHIGQPCPKQATWSPCNYSNCGKPHSNLLHEAEVRGLLMCLRVNAISFTVHPTQSQPPTLTSTTAPLTINTPQQEALIPTAALSKTT